MLEDIARERSYPDMLVVDTSAAKLLAPRTARS
jgi:hypothetical protein